jgi:hypothetical protein
MATGKLCNPNIPFQLFVSAFRRKKILDAMVIKDKTKAKCDGEKVLKAYIKQIMFRKIREISEKGEDASGFTLQMVEDPTLLIRDLKNKAETAIKKSVD